MRSAVASHGMVCVAAFLGNEAEKGNPRATAALEVELDAEHIR